MKKSEIQVLSIDATDDEHALRQARITDVLRQNDNCGIQSLLIDNMTLKLLPMVNCIKLGEGLNFEQFTDWRYSIICYGYINPAESSMSDDAIYAQLEQAVEHGTLSILHPDYENLFLTIADYTSIQNLNSAKRHIAVACLMRVYTIADLAEFGIFTYPFIMKHAPELLNVVAPPFTLNVRSIGRIVPFGTPDWKNYIDDALWQDFN